MSTLTIDTHEMREGLWLPKMGEAEVEKSTTPSAGGVISTTVSGRGPAPRRGTEELLLAYATMPWLRALVHRVSVAISMIEWKVYRPANESSVEARRFRRISRNTRAGDYGEEGTRSTEIRKAIRSRTMLEVEDHPVLDFMEYGNSLFDGLVVRQAAAAHLDLVGDSFQLMEMNGLGEPTELWPIPPTWIRETPVPGGPFVFTLRPPGTGKETEVPGEQMIWYRDINPSDPYGRGVGTARSLADELDIDEFAAKHTKHALSNHAVPDILMSILGVEQDQLMAFKENWNRALQGQSNQGKTHFINREVSIEKIGQTFSELQLIPLRKAQRDIIIEVFGVSPEILGIVENSNRSTIDAADYLFSRWVLTPRLELMRGVLQRQLMSRYPGAENLILDYVSPVRVDKDHAKSVMAVAPWAFYVDDHREAAGREPLPDDEGKVFVTALGFGASLTPAGDSLAEEDLPEYLVNPEDEDEDEDEDEPEVDEDEEETEDDDEGEEEEEEGKSKSVKELSPAAAEKLAKLLGRAALGAAIHSVVIDTIERFGESALRFLGTGANFDMTNPVVVEYLRSESAVSVSRINATTAKAIRLRLATGVAHGYSQAKIAKSIAALFSSSRKGRAKVIARTEVVRASTFGAIAGMNQAGVRQKEWLSARTEDTRDAHTDLDGTRISINSLFVSDLGGSGPGPGNMGSADDDINCLCGVIPVVEGQTGLTDSASREKGWKAMDADRQPLEKQLIKGLRKVFTFQERAVIRVLGELV